MTQYLMAIHLPDDFDPSLEDEAIERDIDALNGEMVAAGVRVFVGGLLPVSSAKLLRTQPGGKVLVTDGPGLSKPLAQTRRWSGGVTPSWPVVCRSRYAAFGFPPSEAITMK